MFAGTQGKSFHQYFKKLQQTNAPFIMTKNIFTLRKFLQFSHSKIVSNWSLRTVSESYLGAGQTFMMELFLMIFKEKYIIIVAWQYPKYAFEFENVFLCSCSYSFASSEAVVKFWHSFMKKETLTRVFSCEFFKFLWTPYLEEHLWWLVLHVLSLSMF